MDRTSQWVGVRSSNEKGLAGYLPGFLVLILVRVVLGYDSTSLDPTTAKEKKTKRI